MHEQSHILDFSKLNFWQSIQMIMVLVAIGVFLFGSPTIWIWQIIALSFAIACLMAVFRFNQQKVQILYESKLHIQRLAENLLNHIVEEDDEVKKRLLRNTCEVMVHNPLMYSDFLTMLERPTQKAIVRHGTTVLAGVWNSVLTREVNEGATYTKPTPPFKAAKNTLGALKLINRACAPRP